MKLCDLRETYYEATGKTSDITRNLAFAGIAIIWIFKHEAGGDVSIPSNLMVPAGVFVLGLLFDSLQYITRSATWGIYHRYMESIETPEDKEFKAPVLINMPAMIFFIIKIVAVFFGYVLLVRWFFLNVFA